MREKTSLPETARFVQTLTGLPVTVIADNCISGFFCEDAFLPYVASHHEWYLGQLEPGDAGSVLEPRYIENHLQESYLEYGLKSGERLMAGPFLLNRSLAQQRKTALEKLGFALDHERIGIAYLEQLKTVTTEEIKAIQFLLFLTQRDLSQEDTGQQRTSSLVADYYRNLIANRESCYHHPPFHLEQQLMEQIRQGQTAQARDTANRLYTHPDASLASTSVRSYRNSLICRCTLYTRAAIDAGVESEAAFTLSDVMINEIEKKNSIQELYRLDLAMIEGFCDLPRRREEDVHSVLVRRTIRHIRDNIYEKLEVAEIARQLFVHPNYLSGRFRKEMEVTISAYVLNLKIEESLKLMAHSDNSISDIAAFLGFSSQSHFGHVFRRIMGVTPLKYRSKQ